ncbi:MAG TPA: NAD(+)--arginine ADP-ribosyltransferase [Mycobacterium sp.]|nr:NAD(+)--arginine ADP-ribosyltransferase [Mycobacterium sp.]
MAPLTVDPAVLDGAGAKVISTGEALGPVFSTLTDVLGGCNGMAGDDPAGAAFGRSYDNSASKLLKAMATTRNGLCGLGYGIQMSAHNYSVAEAMSNVSGHGEHLPVPHQTAAVSAGSTPSAVGSGVGAPAGWGWVAPFIGMIWPNGDSAKLRAAAAAWISAGTNFEVSEITGAVGPMGSIGAQQIPEGPAIAAAFGDASRSAAAILQHCVSISAQLTTYAARIDEVHAKILDLLSRICDPMTGVKEVWEILTDQDEDEIKKIANDIRAIIDQFTTEVDALRQQIAAAVTEAETILTTMGRYAEKEWDQFLHGTPVGQALNQAGQFGKGLVEEGGGLVKDGWTYGLVRAAVDPQGWYNSWSQMIGGIAPLVGLGGDDAPGVGQAWKDLGKNLVHWDEWKTNPAEAAGKSTFDIASLFVPGGGEGAAAAKGARAAVDATEAAAKTAPREAAAVPRALEDAPKPSVPAPEAHKPHVEAPPHEQPSPHAELSGGRPESAPQPKDAPAHPDPSPHSPVESKPPTTGGPLHDGGPRPPLEPSDPGHGPPPPGGGSPPPPGQGPPPLDPHPPMPGSPPHEALPPPDAPHQPAPPPPPGDGPPPSEPPPPAPASSSIDASPDFPPQKPPPSPSGEPPPPADAPHQAVPSPPSGEGHLPPIGEPQHSAAVPSGEGHAPAEAGQPLGTVPSAPDHPAPDGDHMPLAGSPALASVSGGMHLGELAPTAAHAPEPRLEAPSGRPSSLPGAERPSAYSAEPRGGRPTSPPPTSRPHGDAAVGHSPKTVPHIDKPSGLGEGGGPHSTEPGHGGGHDGHGGGAHGGDGHDESSGLSAEKRDEILAMEKGTRPDPSEYLSPEYIEHHLDKFHDGATRFMPENNLDKYGIAQRDGTSFVMPKNEADALMEATRGDPRALERALGLHEGFLDSKKLVRIDISQPGDFNLRIPSGNEAGANEQWIPCGLLPDGAAEAVVDGGKIPPSGYSVSDASK